MLVAQNAQGSTDLDGTFEISSEFNAITPNGVQITFLNVEDSRCPADVLCVWQGEAKVSISIMQNKLEENLVLSTLQDKSSQIFNGLVIKLVDVQPYPYSNKEILQADYVVTLAVSDVINLPPLQQFKSGIGLDKIKCKSSYELVMKKTNGNPACLRSETVPKLIEWGWAVHVLWPADKDKPNSDMFENDPLQITTEEITYFENATGFLARPTGNEAYPGVILIHEWWGLNDNIKEMARALASQGYVVLAANLYASQAVTTPDGARQLVTTFDSQKGIENISAAAEFLRQNHGAEKIATIGWCFGGTQSMNYALSGNKIDATVIYYGQPVTDEAQLSQISWPVLGIFGELDSGIPVEKVNDFQSSLNNLEIQNDIVIYPGVGHAFANPSGVNYAPEETKDAWQKTVSFLGTHLK